MASEIKVVTDSTCDLPDELISRYGITVLPHTVIWGEEQFRDRVDLLPEAFYRRLITDPVLPKTSQITIQSFVDCFNALKQGGASQVVAVLLSSAMSGAYQSAVNAARLVDIPVHIFDGKSVTMGLGWQVLAAARALQQGQPVPAVLEMLGGLRQKILEFVCMDTLKYVATGGRIGNASKFISALLDIKPIVWINHATGVTEPLTIARTYKKAVETFYHKYFERLNPGSQPIRIAVTHGSAPEEAMRLAERIREEYNVLELVVNTTGPVLGINTGPRALALSGYIDS